MKKMSRMMMEMCMSMCMCMRQRAHCSDVLPE